MLLKWLKSRVHLPNVSRRRLRYFNQAALSYFYRYEWQDIVSILVQY